MGKKWEHSADFPFKLILYNTINTFWNNQFNNWTEKGSYLVFFFLTKSRSSEAKTNVAT